MEDDSDDDEAPDLVRVVEPPVDDELAFQTEPSTQPKSVNPTTPLVETELPPCPVTILSGFLGAGKTTLIRYILQSPDHGKKIAIIENEYGDALNIESLIAKDGLEFDNTTDGSNSLQEFIEVPNGCLCCTVKDSLVVTLENLIDKRPDLDCILIECSGLANPGPIANVFWLDDALQSRLYLESIVVVVDALHIANQLTNTLEASQQLGYADRVLINKSDLVQKSNDLSDVQRLVRTIQPTAPVWTTSFATVPDLDWILQTGCYTSEQVPTWNVPEDDTNEQHSHSHHDHGDESSCELCTGTHSHTQGISTLTLTTDDHLDLVKLNRFLADILWPNQDEPEALVRQLVETNTALDDVATTTHDVLSQKTTPELFRVKGIVSIFDVETYAVDNRQYIVQAVQDVWDVHPSINLVWGNDETRTSRLVVIGRHLDKDALVEGFRDCDDHLDLVKLNRFLADILWPNQDEPEALVRQLVETNTALDDVATTTHDVLSQKTTPELFRVKGIVSIFDVETYAVDNRQYIVQAVQDVWDVHPSINLVWGNDETRTSRLVVIGRHLDKDALVEGFRDCRAEM